MTVDEFAESAHESRIVASNTLVRIDEEAGLTSPESAGSLAGASKTPSTPDRDRGLGASIQSGFENPSKHPSAYSLANENAVRESADAIVDDLYDFLTIEEKKGMISHSFNFLFENLYCLFLRDR